MAEWKKEANAYMTARGLVSLALLFYLHIYSFIASSGAPFRSAIAVLKRQLRSRKVISSDKVKCEGE